MWKKKGNKLINSEGLSGPTHVRTEMNGNVMLLFIDIIIAYILNTSDIKEVL